MGENYKNILIEAARLLFPLNRSLISEGNLKSFEILEKYIDLDIKSYKSGTKVYDWQIPKEWVIREAWIKNSLGNKIVDFCSSNLHVLGYSSPINGCFTFEELKSKLYFDEFNPSVIPYKTSYYNLDWGFCISHKDFTENFREGEKYSVYIDSEFKDGEILIGQKKIGSSNGSSYLFSSYICHPSLANDNLSGVLLTTILIKYLSSLKLKNSYTFIIAPETIGAITYCFHNESEVSNLNGGYVLTCVGGRPNGLSIKNSFDSSNLVDRVMKKVISDSGLEYKQFDFSPFGSDERQFSSPFFRVPMCSIHFDKYHEYPEYHTSADNLDFLNYDSILSAFEFYKSIIFILENNFHFRSLSQKCEPFLSKRNLYPKNSLTRNCEKGEISKFDLIIWVLFYGDGTWDLLKLSEILNVSFVDLFEVGNILIEEGLIEKM